MSTPAPPDPCPLGSPDPGCGCNSGTFNVTITGGCNPGTYNVPWVSNNDWEYNTGSLGIGMKRQNYPNQLYITSVSGGCRTALLSLPAFVVGQVYALTIPIGSCASCPATLTINSWTP